MGKLLHFKVLVKQFFVGCFTLPMLLLPFNPAYAIDFLHPTLSKTVPRIGPDNVAVVLNNQDANSLQTGDYYLKARGIPLKNLIVVNIPKMPSLDLTYFEPLHKLIDAQLSANIQVIVLMWTTP